MIVELWLLPLAATIVAFVLAYANSEDGDMGYGFGVLWNLLVYGAATICSLIVWLIWAVLT